MYLISCELLSLTSTADRTSHVFLAYIMLWINKASLALYKACIAQCVTIDRSEVYRSYTALSSFETCHHRSQELVSDTISVIQAPPCRYICTHYMYIDDLLPYAPLPLCSYNLYWGDGQEFHTTITCTMGHTGYIYTAHIHVHIAPSTCLYRSNYMYMYSIGLSTVYMYLGVTIIWCRYILAFAIFT